MRTEGVDDAFHQAVMVAEVLAALAELSQRRGYCAPTLTDEPGIVIREGRHPVVETRPTERSRATSQLRVARQGQSSRFEALGTSARSPAAGASV